MFYYNTYNFNKLSFIINITLFKIIIIYLNK